MTDRQYKQGVSVSHVSSLDRYLDQSGIGGPLPASIGDLLEVEFIQMSFNYFTGPLPASWGKLRSLREL